MNAKSSRTGLEQSEKRNNDSNKLASFTIVFNAAMYSISGCFCWLRSSKITGFFPIACKILFSITSYLFPIQLPRQNRCFPMGFFCDKFRCVHDKFWLLFTARLHNFGSNATADATKNYDKTETQLNFGSFIIFMAHLSYYPRWHHQSKWRNDVEKLPFDGVDFAQWINISRYKHSTESNINNMNSRRNDNNSTLTGIVHMHPFTG